MPVFFFMYFLKYAAISQSRPVGTWKLKCLFTHHGQSRFHLSPTVLIIYVYSLRSQQQALVAGLIYLIFFKYYELR